MRDPRLFLFDEPLSNLDAGLRVATRVGLSRLKAAMPDTTMICGTHDQIKAMTMADRIMVLNAGRIAQVGSPLDLCHRPANRFVASFIGSPAVNFLGRGDFTTAPADAAASIGIRPEDLLQTTRVQPLLQGVVDLCERLGAVRITDIRLRPGPVVVAELPGNAAVAVANAIALVADPARLHRFDDQGQRPVTAQGHRVGRSGPAAPRPATSRPRLVRASSSTAASPTSITSSAAGAASPSFSRLAFSCTRVASVS